MTYCVLFKNRSIRFVHPNIIELFPPGGFNTLDEGRSVSTFPQFMLFPFANALLETLFVTPFVSYDDTMMNEKKGE